MILHNNARLIIKIKSILLMISPCLTRRYRISPAEEVKHYPGFILLPFRSS
nr:MAG TPA: hypothetical protein [Caudoviricetes sp.]